MSELTLYLADEAALLALGATLGGLTNGQGVIFLQGQLGAGKTTLSRGLLRGMGHQGPVKSPTFTLVEPYTLGDVRVYHFDLYRLADPEELEFMGVRDYLDEDSLCLIEWPEQGKGVLPNPDLIITMTTFGQGRQLHFSAPTKRGRYWCAELAGELG